MLMSISSRAFSFLRDVLSSGVRMAASPRLLGRYSGGAGAGQEIQLGAGFSFVGDTLTYTDPGGGATWGAITGTLASQTDLTAALNAKAASSHTHVSANITDAGTGESGASDSGKVVKYGSAGNLNGTYALAAIDAGGFSAGSINIVADGGVQYLWAVQASGARNLRLIFPAASGSLDWNLPNAAGTVALAPVIVTATPTSGFTITATSKVDQTHYLTPAGPLASGTFNLPAAANSQPGQIVRVHSTQNVTALSMVVSGGGTIRGVAVGDFAEGVTYAFQHISGSNWIRL